MFFQGEISLRGRITAVGGIKEKLIGALRAGVKTVLLPAQNRKDVKDLPQEVKDGLQIIHVRYVYFLHPPQTSSIPNTELDVASIGFGQALGPAVNYWSLFCAIVLATSIANMGHRLICPFWRKPNLHYRKP